ncbi:glycosyltransferase family 4 protein [Paenibacillus sp. TRM 82003]|uniref:glycosyltransferase family 4 protein n=1 Tax=Kineococcus sp. TRM81007 TaxID=2925831 RepID=UPI001F55D4BB|nr:glycosyltransferase family 4 protein [Kineococcus sp. TRM81007]MCI2239733.1 glycosyltransferase family 4 protein [Kineococcus sp. TRM81007]MCI3926704.1 glycosyltransferase family 4 protein [Paenibacillus sp. TRM 82003]
MTSRPRVVISIFDDFDNPHYAGGGPVVVRTIAHRLAVDHDVLVVTGGRRLHRSERSGVAHLHLPVTWLGPRGGQLLWALLLPLTAVCLRYDVWIESFTPPWSSNLLPLVTRRPVVGLAQSLSGRDMARRYRTRFPLRAEQRLLRSYRDVVVLNASDQRVVSECTTTTRVHLIPNAVEPPEQPIGGAGEGGYALFLGRIDVGQKGLDLLLDAYAGGGEELLPLVIAGGGRKRDEQELAGRLEGFGARVRWVGPVRGEDKEALIAGSAFLVVPSREESFCLSALEALARGRPVVHFDLPQLRWIPDAGSVAVPPFEVPRLRAAIALLSGDATLRATAGADAARFAREYLARNTPAAYPDLVRQVLARGGPSRDAAPRPTPLPADAAGAGEGNRCARPDAPSPPADKMVS